MSEPPYLSMVVPIRDEREGAENLISRLVPALEDCAVSSFEILLVDDGSRDDTADLLEELCGGDERCRVIRLRRAFGKGDALGAGFDEARGSVIGTIDADLQESPEEIDRLLEVYEDGADLVIGWRNERRDGLAKRISSALFNTMVRWAGGPPLHDGNCGFKLIRKELARELPLSGGRFRFMPLVAAHWGYRVAEVQVSHRKRETGRSHFGPLRAIPALIDLVAVLALLKGRGRPGLFFLKWGFLLSIPGLAILAFIAFLRFSEGTIGFRYPLLAFGSLLLLGGIQLILAGVLAEWLGSKERGRPSYRIDRHHREMGTRERDR
ncbi:MAG: glycosyltransferase family 2 protein [Planctomycetota bacterium]|nr:glycosyltransferase family 2 protein [Planctomycetota bacterium]